MLRDIRIVLMKPSHPGNIGATARAMKTMGLSQLVLVKPKLFPDAQATALAAGADDILAHCQVTDTLMEALSGCHFVIATSARERRLPWPELDPREAAQMALKESRVGNVAMLFGSERVGLLNEELQLAHAHLMIPTDSVYASLNLAAAVQVVCYELRMAFLAAESNGSQTMDSTHLEVNSELVPSPAESTLAAIQEVEAFYQHLEKTLLAVKFLNEKHPVKLMRRLRLLFQRTRLTQMEVNILRGILTAFERAQFERTQ
jgi:tRNA (cytidine32/uridine32-2'-O)-methyltransferase